MEIASIIERETIGVQKMLLNDINFINMIQNNNVDWASMLKLDEKIHGKIDLSICREKESDEKKEKKVLTYTIEEINFELSALEKADNKNFKLLKYWIEKYGFLCAQNQKFLSWRDAYKFYANIDDKYYNSTTIMPYEEARNISSPTHKCKCENIQQTENQNQVQQTKTQEKQQAQQEKEIRANRKQTFRSKIFCKNGEKCSNRVMCDYAHSFDELVVEECSMRVCGRTERMSETEYKNIGDKLCKYIHKGETKETFCERINMHLKKEPVIVETEEAVYLREMKQEREICVKKEKKEKKEKEKEKAMIEVVIKPKTMIKNEWFQNEIENEVGEDFENRKMQLKLIEDELAESLKKTQARMQAKKQQTQIEKVEENTQQPAQITKTQESVDVIESESDDDEDMLFHLAQIQKAVIVHEKQEKKIVKPIIAENTQSEESVEDIGFTLIKPQTSKKIKQIEKIKEKSNIPCLFFKKGWCAKGDRCHYKHVISDNKSPSSFTKKTFIAPTETKTPVVLHIEEINFSPLRDVISSSTSNLPQRCPWAQQISKQENQQKTITRKSTECSKQRTENEFSII